MPISIPFIDQPSRTVAVVLDDLTLHAVDLVRAADPDSPSRSKVLRELIQFALVMMLDDEAVDTLIGHTV